MLMLLPASLQRDLKDKFRKPQFLQKSHSCCFCPLRKASRNRWLGSMPQGPYHRDPDHDWLGTPYRQLTSIAHIRGHPRIICWAMMNKTSSILQGLLFRNSAVNGGSCHFYCQTVSKDQLPTSPLIVLHHCPPPAPGVLLGYRGLVLVQVELAMVNHEFFHRL